MCRPDRSRIASGRSYPQGAFLSVARTPAQAVPARVGGPAAVHRQADPVDESTAIAVRQKGDRLGHIRSDGKARHGHAIDDVGVRIRAAALVRDVHLGFDPTWTDGI